MFGGRNHLTNRQGYENTSISPSDYVNEYGANLFHFFKPFTTDVTASGKPHYQVTVSGYLYNAGATSTGLSPFGTYTEYEGLIQGTGIPSGSWDENNIPTAVRTFGLKTPLTLVGWGFDTFGWPAPNFNPTYAISGIFTSGQASGLFVGSGGYTGTGTTVGAGVPPEFYLSGPLDVRWDVTRKVWSPYWGPIQAEVTGVSISGGGDPTQPQFGELCFYSVRALSAMAENIQLTGISNHGPRFPTGTVKIQPLTTGAKCFLVPDFTPSGTRYVMLGWELPSVTGCDNVTSTGSLQGGQGGGGPTIAASGGTGFTSYSPLDILLGNNSGTLGRYGLRAGTGVVFVYNLNNFAGGFTIGVNTSGFATLSGGINTSITQLSGLTVPLTIAQGGTNSTTQVWVDLGTNQIVASGFKRFVAGLAVGDGGTSNPGLSFVSGALNGLQNNPTGLWWGAVNSGVELARFYNTGTLVTHRMVLQNTANLAYDPPLSIWRPTNIASNDVNLTDWRSAGGTLLAYVGMTGQIYGRFFRVSGMADAAPALQLFLTTGYSYNPIQVVNASGNVVWGLNNSGSYNYIGPTGVRVTTINDGNTDRQITWPLNSGRLALLTDITGGGSSGGTTVGIYKSGFLLASGGTSYNCFHFFNTRDVLVSLYDNTWYDEIEAQVTRPSLSGITVTFSAVTTGDIRCVVLGAGVGLNKASFTLASGSLTYACGHWLNTRDVIVNLYDNTLYNEVEAEVIHTSPSGLTVNFPAVTTGDIRCVVIG